jgi:lipoprotein-anchoring transpeptidase ErfK/SrfK
MEIDGKTNLTPDQENEKDLTNPVYKTPDNEPVNDQNEPVQEQSDKETLKKQSELVQMLLEYWLKIYTSRKIRKTILNVLFIALTILIVLFIFSWFTYIVPGLQETGGGRNLKAENNTELKNDPAYKKQIVQLVRDAQRLSRKFIAYTPGQSYLVINTTDNRFFLYRNKKLFREGFCSTGSYTKLTNAEGSRHWIFKTPKGHFWIQQKITSPLWIRPDWSFVEEGLPIPPANDESRFEYGVLGDYAMSLGDGYLIHGTIYKRFLGMPVTHGCVRLNDDDLEAIYSTLNIGSKVYIF